MGDEADPATIERQIAMIERATQQRELNGGNPVEGGSRLNGAGRTDEEYAAHLQAKEMKRMVRDEQREQQRAG
jgi:hypothetical protein